MRRKQLKVSTHGISTLAIVLIVIVVVASVVAAVIVWWWLAGSVNLVTEEMEFSDFSIVEVGYAFEVEITQSSSYGVDITADEHVEVSRTGEDEYERKLTFDYIQVSKAGDTLTIGLKSGYTYRSSHLLRPLTLRAEITMPDLYELTLSGATRGTFEGFNSLHELILTLSGASSLSARGTANDVLIIASGASHLELSDYPVHNANVTLSGASRATVNLDGRLDADLSGASRLLYIGEPTMGDIQTSGGSTVSEK